MPHASPGGTTLLAGLDHDGSQATRLKTTDPPERMANCASPSSEKRDGAGAFIEDSVDDPWSLQVRVTPRENVGTRACPREASSCFQTVGDLRAISVTHDAEQSGS